MNTRRRAMKCLVVLVALVGLVSSACGGDDETSAGSSQHNQIDIAFATGMIPHHEQAVTMSEYAKTRAGDARVKDIAAEIEAAQEPEIKQMKGFLDDWGVEGDHTGHDAMGGGHPGMLSNAQLGELERSKGREFDRLFLQGMIGHHRGAVTASEKELADGQSPEAKTLAEEIIAAQKAEITEMETILASV